MKREYKTKSTSGRLPCLGCKWCSIANGKEFICNKHGQSLEAVAGAVVDAFFDEHAQCYESTEPTDRPTN